MTQTQRRALAAYWYAVGHADGSGEPDQAEEFKRFHEEQARAYYDHEVSSLSSITDAWRQFKEAQK